MPSTIKAVIVAVALALVILLLGPAACQKIRSQGAQNELNTRQHDALRNSAADAVDTVGDVMENEAHSEAMTRENEREIFNAEGSDIHVSDAAHDAGMHALCQRKAYRDSPACRMHVAPSGSLEKAR